MNEYKRLTAEECAEKLLEIKKPLIAIHIRPDGDCVGTAAALSEIFRQLGEEAKIYSQDKIPERLRFITEHTGAELWEGDEGRTTVSVDVATPSQFGSALEVIPHPVLMIDHHAVGKPYADNFILSEASSSAEVLYDVALLLIKRGLVKMTEELAFSLYTGISSDTGCFCYSNASAATYRKAADIMDTGIDFADINHRLFNSKSKEQIKAEGFVASKIALAFDGKVAYTSVSLREREGLGLASEHFETAIDVVRALLGVEIAMFIRETEPGLFKASLRSTGKDVAAIAAEFGGGGHIRAAGCSPKCESIDEAIDALLTAIENKKYF